MLPNEKECRSIAARALGFARVDDASVLLDYRTGSNTRFANNEVTTSGASDSVNVVVSATRDGRTGRVTLNETSDAALERAVRRAEELAELAPPDPEYVGPLPPQKYAAIRAWDAATEKLDAASRIPGVRAVVEPSARESMNSSGFFTSGASATCVANKAGNFGYHRATSASFSATVRTADGTGSGWADGISHRVADVDAKSIATRALDKARTSVNPQALEPGDYTVILEPAAVAGLMGFALAAALSARTVEEGRSFFSKQGGGSLLGEKLFHESVSLRSDPTDARRPGTAWGGGGGGGGGAGAGADSALATGRVQWIDKGVLQNLWYDRFWANKRDREPTPFPNNLVLEGGKETLQSLIAATERGLLVTNFWYIRSVNPQTLQVTGLTRDGLWLVENGKVTRPIMNFRFNESPAVMLANVLGMTAAVRSGNMVVPAIKAANFTFSSRSDAV
jgi:predicted Zn-dependent protease